MHLINVQMYFYCTNKLIYKTIEVKYFFSFGVLNLNVVGSIMVMSIQFPDVHETIKIWADSTN